MSAKTGIGWTDATWNPVVGCTQISPGCAHCYAKTLHDMRHKAFQAGKLQSIPQYAHPFETVQLMPARLAVPLSWRAPRRVFVNSLADLFHDDVPFGFIARVFMVMAEAERHTFQVLTKRPERACAFFDWIAGEGSSGEQPAPMWPLPNVWFGVSVENQKFVERIVWLASIPAAVRFVSFEPLLGPINLHGAKLDWAIAGGESGPGYREMDIAWLRSLHEQCAAVGTPIFVKQDSGPKSGEQGRIPDDLWIQEFPDAR